MQKVNDVVLTGTYVTEQITNSFTKQSIRFASKDRDGNWKDGDFEIYIKPDLTQQSGIQPGDLIKAKGFIVFNFFTKQDGTQMTFPKMIATEILEVEKADGQPATQPTQPQAMMNTGNTMTPPQPGNAPQAPQPQMQDPNQAFGAPPVPPMPQPAA